MGRTLPVPVPCQICGDKSYGRHYGVYCCDGCSCFFKRSIRKKISYTCICDNQCIIDKARRNWCPACRLKKCYDVKMNETAVQEERGPRKRKVEGKSGRREPSESIPKRTNKKSLPNTQGGKVEGKGEVVREVLMRAVQNAVQGPVLKFASAPARERVLGEVWHSLFLLYTASTHTNLLETHKHNNTQFMEVVKLINAVGLDPQELHLSSSLLLCSPGPTEEASIERQTGELQDLYRLMLLNHETMFYPTDPLRSAKILYVISALRSVRMSDVQRAIFPENQGHRVLEMVSHLSNAVP